MAKNRSVPTIVIFEIHRVIRGGSWNTTPLKIHVSNRKSIEQYGIDSSVGFRIVRE
jgi:formylglycine-generating enzyme required for sulfatase activity